MMEKQNTMTFHEELEEEFGSIHIWRMGLFPHEGKPYQIYVSQGKKCLGNVVASVVEDYKLDKFEITRVNRKLTQKEMQEIVDFFEYQSEPHDLDHFKKDVFNVED